MGASQSYPDIHQEREEKYIIRPTLPVLDAIKKGYSQRIQGFLVQRLVKKGNVNWLMLTGGPDIEAAIRTGRGVENFCTILPSHVETLCPLIKTVRKFQMTARDEDIEGCTKVLDCLRKSEKLHELLLFINQLQPTQQAGAQWRDSLSSLLTHQPTMKLLHLDFYPAGNEGDHDLVLEALCNSKHRLKQLKLIRPFLSTWSKMGQWLSQGPLAEHTEIVLESPSGRWSLNPPTGNPNKESLDALKHLQLICHEPVEGTKEWMECFFLYLENTSLPNLEELEVTYKDYLGSPVLASAVVSLLQKNVLKKLSLSGFNYTASEMKKICRALKHNSSLISFSLARDLTAAVPAGLLEFAKVGFPQDAYIGIFEDALLTENTTLASFGDVCTHMPQTAEELESWKDMLENWKVVRYLTDLNKFGRRKARNAKLSLEVIGLISSISGLRQTQDNYFSTSSLVRLEREYLFPSLGVHLTNGTDNWERQAELAALFESKKVGLIYGLLKESIPIWSAKVE